ncbi:uncharacterized protein [Euphorbia lathyris]|uniref:uncharacterized protein n=1 Tax=Euphorbia lathyris TaxID=212925 RepID=UPI003313AC84
MISLAPLPSPQWMVHKKSSSLNLMKFSESRSSSSSFRVACSGGSPPPTDLKFVLHEALDSAGIDTANARDGRKGFLEQIEKLTMIERGTSISINRRVDLWKTALYIAAEDDSLVSQSSVPLPVDYFAGKLFDFSMNFCTHYSSSLTRSSPEELIHSLERYLYVNNGFRRSNRENQIDPQALYLHSVLMEGSGSAAMLSLIYSETLKVLRMWSFLDFDCEIFFPLDRFGLPRGYNKRKMKNSDQPHIVTTQILLQEILRNMKETFWPFQHDYLKSLFLRAADAVNCIHRSSTEESGFGRASATSATRHRLDYGELTNISNGDMRLALSACERLIMVECDPKELRDYSILLYHCGFYDLSLQYLKLYKEREQTFSLQRQASNKNCHREEEAVEKLMTRLTLISMEDGWTKPSYSSNFLQK